MPSIATLLAALLAVRPAWASDGDGDGFDASDDCNDASASIHPGATELSNGVDDDCDGQIDEGLDDTDDDSDGYTEQDGDCDDADPASNPGVQADGCGGVDEDCDGLVDENCASIEDDDTGIFYEYTGAEESEPWCGATDAPADWWLQVVVAAATLALARMNGRDPPKPVRR